MNHQTVEVGVWMALPVLALIWANLTLLHERRVLKHFRQVTLVQEVRLVPPVVLVPSVATAVPSAALAS